jgi:hypothetical protein
MHKSAKVLIFAALATALVTITWMILTERGGATTKAKPSPGPRSAPDGTPPALGNWSPPTAAPQPHRKFVKRAGEFSSAEIAELHQNFKDRFQPAIQKWTSAYGERVPAEIATVSVTNFVERLGANTNYSLYTFVVGDFTLTIQDTPRAAKVMYLMSKSGARLLNTDHPGGAAPDISVPVQRDEIIRMAYADAGRRFNPNEVHITPTALGTGVNGGAFVKLIPEGADPNNDLSVKLDMVFGPDGKLLNYERDPQF